MQDAEAYLAAINQMQQFLSRFTARVQELFEISFWHADENARVGGPLVASYHLPAYEVMPTEEALWEVADAIGEVPFDMEIVRIADPGTEFDKDMCYFYLAIDYAKDIYFIRKSDTF